MEIQPVEMPEMIPSNFDSEAQWDVVYSDGACKGNGKHGSVAGVGAWYGPDDPRSESSTIGIYSVNEMCRNLCERCPGDQTNNRAELIVSFDIQTLLPI